MAIRRTHPLVQRELGYLRSWREWLELWNGPFIFEIHRGLLHVGLRVRIGEDLPFGVPSTDETYSKRILYYLQIANGWCQDPDEFDLSVRDPSGFQTADPVFRTGFGVFRGKGSLHQGLAAEAFKTLMGVFVPHHGPQNGERGFDLNTYTQTGRLTGLYVNRMSLAEIRALLNFFRPVPQGGPGYRYWGFRNLPSCRDGRYKPEQGVSEHLLRQVHELLADWLVYLWKISATKAPGIGEDARGAQEEQIQKIARASRFRILLMLACLGERDKLATLELDQLTLKQVCAFVMRCPISHEMYDDESSSLVWKRRRPKSWEEVAYCGKGVHGILAELILSHQIIRRGQAVHDAEVRKHKRLFEGAQRKRNEKVRLSEARVLEGQVRKLKRKLPGGRANSGRRSRKE